MELVNFSQENATPNEVQAMDDQYASMQTLYVNIDMPKENMEPMKVSKSKINAKLATMVGKIICDIEPTNASKVKGVIQILTSNQKIFTC